MAIFHCQAKAISRATGRSATAAAAYRAAVKIKDDRTGEVFDFTGKQGVVQKTIILPESCSRMSRTELWNAAEQAEKRKDAKVAREWELALPIELSAGARVLLAVAFGRELVRRYGVAADDCIHTPNRHGDQRNWHAHILTTTRRMEGNELKEKTRILDSPLTSGKEVEAMRQLWAEMANRALNQVCLETIDHRSLADQGIDRVGTKHLGPAATQMERRGIKTERGDLNRSLEHEAGKELEILRAKQEGITKARQNFEAWKKEKAAQKVREENRLMKIREADNERKGMGWSR
ncbi:MAG: MobA/MobL family protein [Mailhella sp.]|nr:MobA/MobL family protein [Mailhella sp.]